MLKHKLAASFSSITLPERQSYAGSYSESFWVLERQVIYTHANGAQTVAYQLERKLKNEVLEVSEVVAIARSKGGKFLFNSNSGGIAVGIATDSKVDKNGAIVERVNLIGVNKSLKVENLKLLNSSWREIPHSEFVRRWQERVDELPKFTTSTLYLITGLLLPIWNYLDSLRMKVYRLQTDGGERLLGRVVYPETIEGILKNFGVNSTPATPKEIFEAVVHRQQTMPLSCGWQLKFVTVKGNQRLEVVGTLGKAEFAWLESVGCFTEIIDWRMRAFVPVSEKGIDAIARICE